MDKTEQDPTDDWERSAEDVRFELAVARTILAWNECELHLVFFLQSLLGIDQFRARVIWSGLPTFDAKRKMLMRLSVTFTPHEVHTKFDKLLSRCSKMATNRNILAHGFGGYNPSTRKVEFYGDTQHPELGTDFLGSRKYDLANIEGWPHAIRALIRDLMALLREYSAKVSALPRMHVQDPITE